MNLLTNEQKEIIRLARSKWMEINFREIISWVLSNENMDRVVHEIAKNIPEKVFFDWLDI